MRGSCVDLSRTTELRWLSDLIGDVRASIPGQEILLVGAMARDIVLHYGAGVPIARASQDIDLAIAVADWSTYDAVRTVLVRSPEFTAGYQAEHRLVHSSGTPIDLIPFGAITGGDGRITWPEDGNTMRVVGFREAHDGALTVSLPNRRVVRVVALPMLAALKLCAWFDRRQARPNVDARDLFLILRQYEAVRGSDCLYDEHSDLLERDEFDQAAAFAEILGRDCRASIENFSADPRGFLDVLASVLKPEVDPEGALRLATEGAGRDTEQMLQLLNAFDRGLRGE